MFFFRSLLLTSALFSLLITPVKGMEGKGDRKESLNPKGISKSLPSRKKSPSPERAMTQVSSLTAEDTPSVASLKGFQDYYETEVSDEEWAKFLKLVDLDLETRRENIAQTPSKKKALCDLTGGVSVEDALQMLRSRYEENFKLYFDLYRTLLKGKKIEDSTTGFFIPLRNFVFQVHDIFRNLRGFYSNKGEDTSFLGRHYFPPLQRTFNVMVRAWEGLTGKTSASRGPIEDRVKTLINDGQQDKHLYYVRDRHGFILFYVSPREPLGTPKDNLYIQHIPYQFHMNDDAMQHCAIFSLEGVDSSLPHSVSSILALFGTTILSSVTYSEDVRMVDNQGLWLRDDGKVCAMTPYSGGFGNFPYTYGRSISFVHNEVALACAMMKLAAALKIDIHQKEDHIRVLKGYQDQKATVDALLKDTFEPKDRKALETASAYLQKKIYNLKRIAKKVSDLKEGATKLEKEAEKSVPERLKGSTRFASEPTQSFEQFAPQIEEWIKKQLKGKKEGFFKFPNPGIEEQEVTYQFLLDIHERVQDNKATQEDKRFLELVNLEPENLPGVIQELEDDLVNEYEREIQAEWETRQKQVVAGTAGSLPAKQEKKATTQGKQSTKNNRKRAARTQASSRGASGESTNGGGAAGAGLGAGAGAASVIDTSASSGLGLSSTNDSMAPQVKERARKRLQDLKEAQTRGGRTKFRKFMQLVNFASNGLQKLGVKVLSFAPTDGMTLLFQKSKKVF